MKFDIDSRNLNIVEKKKIWFCIPAAVLALAVILGIIFGFAFKGNVLNLGIDFTGGYTITVKLGAQLDNPAFRSEKEKQITDIIENPDIAYSTDEIGQISELVVRDITMQGENSDKSLYIKFTADHYNYQVMMGSDENKGIIDILGDEIKDKAFDDLYAGSVSSGTSVSATVSSELLITCICAVIMALALMLIYIAIRFEMLSGVVALVCLVHDIAMMFLFMLIFHIEITSTFVAALITILGYSINNTIIIFDKVRDKVKTMPSDTLPSVIANESVRDTLVRSINTTGTTMLTVVSVAIVAAIFGVGDLIIFCLPLVAGLVAGTFSSLLLAPSIWAMWKERRLKKAPAPDPATASGTDVPADDFLDGLDAPSSVPSGDKTESENAAEEKAVENAESVPDNQADTDNEKSSTAEGESADADGE